ncbi:hypothetical protein GYH30_006308, partial [Glycine max]
ASHAAGNDQHRYILRLPRLSTCLMTSLKTQLIHLPILFKHTIHLIDQLSSIWVTHIFFTSKD